MFINHPDNHRALENRMKPSTCLLVLPLLGLILCSTSFAGEVNVTVSNQSGQPVENAVVYAESPNKSLPSNLSSAAIEQRNRTFLPLVTVVQTGSSITFPNNDSVRHHVYSFSPAKSFELKLYSGVPAKPVLFDKPGTVVLGCNIHDQMHAFVQVVDTPFFGKTDANGKLKLSDIPNGNYILKTWHFNLIKENIPVEQPLVIKGIEQVTVKLDTRADL